MAAINVDITKAFGNRFLVKVRFDVALTSPLVFVLFGPSGSGKTTLLRCLAGLEWPDHGCIVFDNRVWFDGASSVRVQPQQRRIGYSFQDYALFPTHTVVENITYGLGNLPAVERKRRVADIIALLGLHGMDEMKPSQLSGGQQQRVALARAIAPHPSLLLLDEPLSALDLPTRTRLRGELRELLRQLAIPSVVVTHDWEEALALGDQMIVLDKGHVLQQGTPQEIFNLPTNVEVAKIVGMETVVPGRIAHAVDGLVTVEANEVKLLAVSVESPGTDVFVCIRAEDVVLEPVGSGTTSARNHVPAIVHDIVSMGAFVRVNVDAGFPLSAIVTRPALDDLHLMPGTKVVASMKAGAVHLIARPSSMPSS